MFMKSGLVALALVTAISGAASATAKANQTMPQAAAQSPTATPAKQSAGPRAYISGFTDGIWSWKPDGRGALLIKSRRGKWYRATLTGGCDVRVPIAIGFAPGPGGDFDRFSSVLVDGQRCHIRTFDRLDAPVRAAKPAS